MALRLAAAGCIVVGACGNEPRQIDVAGIVTSVTAGQVCFRQPNHRERCEFSDHVQGRIAVGDCVHEAIRPHEEPQLRRATANECRNIDG